METSNAVEMSSLTFRSQAKKLRLSVSLNTFWNFNFGTCLIVSKRITESVTAFKDWLRDEVRFRVEAAEMADGIEPKTFEHVKPPRAPKYLDLGRMRNSHTAVVENETRNMWSPCSLCQKSKSWSLSVWFCKQLHDKGVYDCWWFAKERKVCFGCLTTDHKRKDCRKARRCQWNRSLPSKSSSPSPWT